MTLFITESEVTNILSHKKAIELLDEGMKAVGSGKAFNLPRKRIPVGYGGGAMNIMAASWPEKGIAGHKSYIVSKGKATFVVLLYSTEGNGLLAVIEANMLGQIRTGAASGLASKYMANNKSKTLSIIGTGFQAQSQLLSIASIFDLDAVNVYSRSENKRNLFVSNLSKQVEADARSNLRELVFKTVIPRNVRVSEAPSYSMPVLTYDPSSKGSKAYMDLAKELLANNS